MDGASFVDELHGVGFRPYERFRPGVRMYLRYIAIAGYQVDLTQRMPLAYQGHLYQILKVQRPDVPGGAMNYFADGQLRNGFALIAWSASYESTGIMTFLANQDGIVQGNRTWISFDTRIASCPIRA